LKSRKARGLIIIPSSLIKKLGKFERKLCVIEKYYSAITKYDCIMAFRDVKFGEQTVFR